MMAHGPEPMMPMATDEDRLADFSSLPASVVLPPSTSASSLHSALPLSDFVPRAAAMSGAFMSAVDSMMMSLMMQECQCIYHSNEQEGAPSLTKSLPRHHDKSRH